MKIDHISEHGIRRLVDEFYARVRADTELAPIFNRAIPPTGDYTLRRCATFGRR
jgi:hemoglobin